MAIAERRKQRRQSTADKVKAAPNLPRDILRCILGPMFGGVERHDANRVIVLAGHQVADGGFEIGFAEIGFRKQLIAPCPENRLHLTRGFEICVGLVERRGSVGLMFARIGTR